MTEQEAKDWLDARDWWTGEVGDRLRALVALVTAEAARQNLISAATIDHFWSRHIVDSAQLLPVALSRVADDGAREASALSWIDLGTGAGFPGLVIACLLDRPIRLVEMRKLRVAFLEHCIEALSLCHARVEPVRARALSGSCPATVISARAFAPLERLLDEAVHLSDQRTVWLLPKGRKAQLELETARKQWQAAFHVEHSVTDPDSVIIVAQGVERRIHQRPARPARSRFR